jgi:hypothetical protein
MAIVMQITITENDFAQFERTMLDVRAWLNADPETKAGRGDTFAAHVPTEDGGQEIFLSVRRDEEE